MKKIYTWLGVGALAVLMQGCEWTTGGGVESWNNVGVFVDFSGSYKAFDNGILVREFGTVIVTNTVSESLGTGNGTNTEFSGFLGKQLVSGTLTILAGGYRITDSTVTSNQSGTVNLTVTPSDGTIATYNYGTRAWTLKFIAPLASGTAISASYSTLDTQSDTRNQGNHGQAIYSFVVYQIGSRVQIRDSNNASYEGNIGNVRTTGGTPNPDAPPTAGPVEAQFSAVGVSQGYNVQIVGVLQGTLSASTLSGRTMRASFIEEGGFTADIYGVAQ